MDPPLHLFFKRIVKNREMRWIVRQIRKTESKRLEDTKKEKK